MMASTTDNSTTNCASCGKEGGNLNTCNKCKMVKYCNAACKKKHRSKHKKACEERVAELHDEELFKDPPYEDCPICVLPFPLDAGQTMFQSCCGKIICNGCILAMIEEAHGRGKIGLCAFCRNPASSPGEESIKRIKKLMEADNAYAFHQLAVYYDNGDHGMPQNIEKANELYLKAGELGCATAYLNLGISYDNGDGVEVDKKKEKYYYELAAMNGCVDARHNLGLLDWKAGNYHRAYKHFILSAKAGYKDSLDQVKIGFMGGHVTKDEYANTLRAHQDRVDEMKSDVRDRARANTIDDMLRVDVLRVL